MKYISIFFIFFVGISCAQINQVDANGLKQGLWYKNFPGTKIHMYEGTFKDDKPVGIFTYRYESGSVKAIVNNKQNSKLAFVKMYFENEAIMSEGSYYDQKKDSVWINYNERGELVSAESYIDDKLNGKKIIYYLNEQLEAGKMNVLSITNYINDLKEGAYKEFHPSGKLKSTGNYVKGERFGEWVDYYNTGQVMTRVRYHRDLLHGWAYYYDKNGNQLSKTMWRDGFKLEGKDLEMFLKRCKDKNLDPNQ